MRPLQGRVHPGIWAALTAAVLFGVSTPLAKVLLGGLSPWMLAGLLYVGSGLALACWRLVRGHRGQRIVRGELTSLIGAIGFGGILAPVLLMVGLAGMPASGASLLLNAEAVLTVAIAWLLFGEHVNRRTMAGFALILAGVLVLGWQGQALFGGWWPTLALLAACLCWALDNNLTRRVSSNDALLVACLKGLLAGVTNTAIALQAGATLPGMAQLGYAGLVGFLGYGLSLSLFVVALRTLGTARTGAYFSVAPLFGVMISLALWPDMPGLLFWAAAALMGLGVWLHLSERHAHQHTHETLWHSHPHRHDVHHQHAHDFAWDGTSPHAHPHQHEPLAHTHAHYPDIHHRHPH